MTLSRSEAFEAIYLTHSWGGRSHSGPGSDPEHSTSYLRFVNQWLEKHPDCRNIVELGCGDWATTSRIKFPPRHSYVGLDIVPGVIAMNRERYQSEAVRFECSDFLCQPPPGGDLLLIKDVLQHLTNACVHDFIRNVLPRFRYAIITNDVRKYEKWRRFGIITIRRQLQEPNIDITDGSSRPLRLDAPPFSLEPAEKSTYSVLLRKNPRRVIYEKDIVVWCNNQSPATSACTN